MQACLEIATPRKSTKCFQTNLSNILTETLKIDRKCGNKRDAVKQRKIIIRIESNEIMGDM